MIINRPDLRWYLRLSLALAAVIVVFSPTAAAHGILLGSTPPANAAVATSPDRLELRFNEPVNPQLSRIVLVRGARRIPLGLVAAEGLRLSYNLPPLEPDVYLVDWFVISAVDGHLTRGTFAFGIGETSVPAGMLAVTGPPWPDVAVRWVGLVGLFVLLGGVVTFLWLPAPEAASQRLRAGLYHLAVGATAAVAASGVARVLIDAVAIADEESGPGPVALTILRVLGISPLGHDVLFRVPAAVFLMLLLRRDRPLDRGSVIPVLGVLLIGPTLTSHGLSVGLGGVLIGLVHLIAASIWVGGLAFFGAIYLPVVRTVAPDAARPAALRFSRLALIAVGALILTGFAQSWLYVGAPSALPQSAYGRTLLGKLILLAPLLLIAAVNRWRVLPRLTASRGAGRTLTALVRLETALGLTVALLAAAVAITQPAKTPGLASAQKAQTLVLGGIVEALTVRLSITPPQQGRSRIEVTATRADGQPLAGEVRYRVRLFSLSRDLPARVVSLESAQGQPAGASAGADGLFFDAPGWWSMELRVRRSGRRDAFLLLPLFIEPEGVAASNPNAMALLQRAESLVKSLRAWQETEMFSDGEGSNVTTHYTFVAPDRMAYRTSAGSEGRVIGQKSFFRDRGGPWMQTQKTNTLRVAFRFPLAAEMAGAALGARIEDDNRTLQIVTYQESGGLMRFAAWIDLATGLPRRIMMHGPGHYMISEIGEYNRPTTIIPP
ncbi:MAG: copper resistance CopC/CopD family protein [Armatimonadota bacterium]